MRNPFENFTPEQKDLQKKRDIYEKQAESDAKKVNTFYENLTKTGLKKEDVIYEDALDEKSVREQKDDYRLVCGKEDLEKMAESALMLTEKNKEGRSLLEGIIDGKKVKIEFDGNNKYEGIFNDENISGEMAAEIYNKYASVAKNRADSIQITHDVEKGMKNLKAYKPKMYAMPKRAKAENLKMRAESNRNERQYI